MDAGLLAIAVSRSSAAEVAGRSDPDLATDFKLLDDSSVAKVVSEGRRIALTLDGAWLGA